MSKIAKASPLLTKNDRSLLKIHTQGGNVHAKYVHAK